MAFPGEGVNGEQGRIKSEPIYGVLSNTVMFRPNIIGQFRLSTTRRVVQTEPRSAGYDFTQLGFPESLLDHATIRIFPRFEITDAINLGPDRASFCTNAEENPGWRAATRSKPAATSRFRRSTSFARSAPPACTSSPARSPKGRIPPPPRRHQAMALPRS